MEDFGLIDLERTIRRQLAGPVAEARGSADLAGIAARTAQIAEGWLLEHQSPEERAHIACGPECGTCCAVEVDVLFPEAVAIGVYLRDILPPQMTQTLLRRIEELEWMGAEKEPGAPCPFLDEGGSCAVYPVRPLMCRAITSTDPDNCRKALALAAFGIDFPIMMNVYQKDVMDSAFGALGATLSDSGRDGRSFGLAFAVGQILENPDLVDAWARGADISLH